MKSSVGRLNMIGGNRVLKKLIERAFCSGIAVGIALYQTVIISAHKRKEPLIIGDTLYYLQDGRERLQEALEEICK